MKRIWQILLVAILAVLAWALTLDWKPEVQVHVQEVEGKEVMIATTSAPIERAAEAVALEEYLKAKGAHELAEYADEIIELPRWQEAIAITAKETSFCNAGVGSSRNNCGAIRSSIAGRGFKIYENVFDAVWDISYLLQKPRYVNLTIEEMNGIYCVNEAAGGGKCPMWAETINAVINELESAILATSGGV